MINPKKALELLRTYYPREDSALKNPEMYQKHVLSVAEACYQTAFALFRKNYDVDPDFVMSGGILHDIGKILKESYEYGEDIHEYYTGEILREKGFPEAADIAQTHFIAFEKAGHILVPRGYDVNPEDYKQINLPEKILTYADLIVRSDGKQIKWQKNLATLIPKYEKENDSTTVDILSKGGLKRMENICSEIERLLE